MSKRKGAARFKLTRLQGRPVRDTRCLVFFRCLERTFILGANSRLLSENLRPKPTFT